MIKEKEKNGAMEHTDMSKQQRSLFKLSVMVWFISEFQTQSIRGSHSWKSLHSALKHQMASSSWGRCTPAQLEAPEEAH